MEKHSFLDDVIQINLDDTNAPKHTQVPLLDLCQRVEKIDYYEVQEQKKKYVKYFKKLIFIFFKQL